MDPHNIVLCDGRVIQRYNMDVRCGDALSRILSDNRALNVPDCRRASSPDGAEDSLDVAVDVRERG